MVLGFEGMTKAADRQTNKYQKLYKKIYLPDNPNYMLQVAYNSLAYDFSFSLLIQTRGLTQASQLTEEVLSHFNPTMNLNILECPIFTEMTETQILISDPAFEINQEFEETGDAGVNIISVSFEIIIRGNVYSPISMIAPIKTIKLFTHIWDQYDYNESKLSTYYNFTKENENDIKITERVFNGTIPWDKTTEYKNEDLVIRDRPDYKPHEKVIKTKNS